MLNISTFGELQRALENRALDGLDEVGYYFLEGNDGIVSAYIDIDAEFGDPKELEVNKRHFRTGEEYDAAYDAMPLTKRFWRHVQNRAEIFAAPECPDGWRSKREQEEQWTIIEYNQSGGDAILAFLEKHGLLSPQ